MIEISKLELDNSSLKSAIRGMRNPLKSWDMSDSYWTINGWVLGDNDKKLATRLLKAGSDHSKFARMIWITADINAPLYWWKEFETYRLGVNDLDWDNPTWMTMNSESTMHTLMREPFTYDMFSHDYLMGTDDLRKEGLALDLIPEAEFKHYIRVLNGLRDRYLETNDKRYWYQIIQMLPNSWMQKRTVQINLSAARNMYRARKDHKQDEWRLFCDELANLEEVGELITC